MQYHTASTLFERNRYLTRISIVVVSMAAICFAATSVQAQTDATHPSVPEDQLTPRGTVKVLRTTMLRGDADALRGLIQTASPREETTLRLLAENISLQAAVRRAVYSKFPSAVPDPGKLADDQIAMSNPGIDAMRETITGDSATVLDPSPTATTNPSQQMHMNLVGGKWKIPFEVIKPILHLDPDETDYSMVNRRLTTENPVLKQFAADINAGMFKTTKDLSQAGKDRMLKALAEALGAQRGVVVTTRPITRP